MQVILDRSQRTEKYSEADFLVHEGIPSLIDAQHAIAHNKVMVIDAYLVLTGSLLTSPRLPRRTTPRIYW